MRTILRAQAMHIIDLSGALGAIQLAAHDGYLGYGFGGPEEGREGVGELLSGNPGDPFVARCAPCEGGGGGGGAEEEPKASIDRPIARDRRRVIADCL